MHRFTLALLILTMSAASSSLASEPPCPRQPMPSPLDSLSSLPSYKRSISFAAIPTLGGQAWVIRLDRAGQVQSGTVEIMQLRRQADCNRYDVEGNWKAPLSDEQYRLLSDKIAPFAIAPPGEFSGAGSTQAPEIALDGSPIILNVKTFDWEVTRSLNHYAGGGAELSAIFHAIVSQHVPDWKAPRTDWRPRSE